jgi:hypothetical protein
MGTIARARNNPSRGRQWGMTARVRNPRPELVMRVMGTIATARNNPPWGEQREPRQSAEPSLVTSNSGALATPATPPVSQGPST